MPADRSALGAFLRSRRDSITPDQAGISPFPGPRRVPGLRKEEVAFLAGLSTDHYSRLEQGRQATLTDQVRDALARALGLTVLEREHLRNLATSTGRRSRGWDAPQRPNPGLVRIMAALDDVPTLLIGRRSEVLASGGSLGAVLGVAFEPGESFVRWLFLDPRARQRIENWEDFAATAVGSLRYEVGRHPDDRRLAAQIDEFRASDPDVARWWDDHGVTDRTSSIKRISHPTAGPLEFGVETVTTPHDPEQRLIVYTVEPDSQTARVLPLLRSWGAEVTA